MRRNFGGSINPPNLMEFGGTNFGDSRKKINLAEFNFGGWRKKSISLGINFGRLLFSSKIILAESASYDITLETNVTQKTEVHYVKTSYIYVKAS